MADVMFAEVPVVKDQERLESSNWASIKALQKVRSTLAVVENVLVARADTAFFCSLRLDGNVLLLPFPLPFLCFFHMRRITWLESR